MIWAGVGLREGATGAAFADALARAAREHKARGAFFVAMEPATGEVLVFTGWAKEQGGMRLDVQANRLIEAEERLEPLVLAYRSFPQEQLHLLLLRVSI